MITDPVILAIYRRFPPRESIFKPSDGRAELEYDRHSSETFFGLFERDLSVVVGKDVLDLGCGFGSQAVQYLEAGAKHVVGVEIDDDKVGHARSFAEERGFGAVSSFVVGMGERLPLGDRSFDVVTMDDVLEHVIDPEAVLRECHRVLRPGGVLLASFPPYYCIHGGSHLEGYATRFPGMNLLFTTKALRSASQQLFERENLPWRDYLREVPTDKLWNQNGLTAHGVGRIVRSIPFSQTTVRYIGLRDRRKASMREPLPTPVFWLLEHAAAVPGLREVLCARVALELYRGND